MRARLALALLLACGGSTTPPLATDASVNDADADADAPREGGGADARPDAGPDAGACVAVSQEGTTCAPGEKSCDRVDPCCASAFECVGGAWKLQGQSCALCPSHPCADTTCPGDRMCILHDPTSPIDPIHGDCVPYPTACARNWTCGCVEPKYFGCLLKKPGCTDTTLPVTLHCSSF